MAVRWCLRWRLETRGQSATSRSLSPLSVLAGAATNQNKLVHAEVTLERRMLDRRPSLMLGRLYSTPAVESFRISAAPGDRVLGCLFTASRGV